MKGVIMESYIITYDLKYSSNNYDDLIDKIKNYPKWAHVNESVWIVKSNTSTEDIRNNLTTVINSNDSLFVGALTGEAAWRNVIDSNSAIKECF